MLRVGLTGGLATGKTLVGATLAELGCLVIKADVLGHQVLARDGEAFEAVVNEFGPKILSSDGEIDRRKLAHEVFGHPERLERLNTMVHPPVRARGRRLAEEFFADHPNGIAVTEAAILIEKGQYSEYARLIVTVCARDQQVERAMARDRLSREEVEARLARQMPVEETVKYADYVVDTSGPKEQTVSETRAVYESLERLARAPLGAL